MMRDGRLGLAILMLFAGGCAARGNVELLESQLRQQEDRLYALNQQMTQAETDLTVARREVEVLRIQLAERGDSILLPEQSQALFRVAGVRVQKLLTGGLDRDGRPGDDLLNVVIVPHDQQGEAVKLPGDLEIEVIDLAASERSRQLGLWRFSSADVAKNWQSGLTSGFQFRMPWQRPPESEDIVVHARFRTADGRHFGTSAEIHVTPAQKAIARLKERNKYSETASSPGSLSPAPPESQFFVDQASRSENHTESGRFSLSTADESHEKPPLAGPLVPPVPEEREFLPPIRCADPAPTSNENERFSAPETKTVVPLPAPAVQGNTSDGDADDADFQYPETPADQSPKPPRELVWTSRNKQRQETGSAPEDMMERFRAASMGEPETEPEAEKAEPAADEVPMRYRRSR